MSAASRIARAVEGVRGHLSRSLGVMVVGWCGAAVLLLLIAAVAVAGGGGWSAGSPGPLLIVLLIGAVVPAGVWVWRRLGRHWCAEHRVTRAMDRIAGLDEGAVLGGLELSRAAPPGTSPGLRDLALEQVGSRLEGDSRTLAGPLGEGVGRRVRRGVTAFLAALPAVLLVLALAPARTLSAWGGLLSPLAVLVEPLLPPVSVEPGTIEVARGAVVEVTAHAPLRDSVTLRWDVTGQVTRAQTVTVAEGAGRSSLPPVHAETSYWIVAPDGAASDVHVLTPVDPLFVNEFTLEVTHPPHTGLPPNEYQNEVPDLAIPAGTHLRVRGRGSRTIGAGTLLDGEGRTVLELEVRGANFEAGWVPSRSGTYAWRFSDAGGGAAAAVPEPFVIEVVPDLPPVVAVVYPGIDTIMPVALRQPLVIHAGDDYGIERVEIVVRRVSAFGESGEPVVHRVELGGSAGAIVRPVLDVSSWTLTPGDTIRYLARAVDNNPVPRMRESIEYALWIGGTTELERAAEEELSRAAEGVEDLAEEARRAEEEALDLQARSAAEGSREGRDDQARFEDREEIARALERQEEMMAAVDSLQRELAELRDALRDAGLADPELQERIGELEELLNQAAPEEGPEELDELAEQLSQMDPAELREALEQMAEDQERLRQRLEDSLEQFRDAAIEQDFRATGQEAEELAEEQEILAKAMLEGGDEALRAEQQEALEARAQELQQQLEELQQRVQEAGEMQASAGVQEARHQLSQARQQMQQAAQMAQQGQQQSAGQQAQQAAGDLSQVAQQLNQSQMQMQMQQMEAIRAALGRTAADALALARRQTELRGEMHGASPDELAALRGDEAAIAQGLRYLAENYAEDTEMAAPGARDLLTAVGTAMEQLDGTISALENPRTQGPSPAAAAEQVVRTLNEVAQMAMTSGQQQGQPQGAASASEQMMQQLQQLAEQQGEIMQDASALTPMRLGEETLREQVEEVAERQEQVAEDLDEMNREGTEEGDPLGDLSAFAEEARRLAEALAGGRLDPEVLRRQERLFHRLLDAGRTLERDEESEERESEEPGSFTREGVSALSAGDLNVLRYALPGAAALRALPPAQRALVVKYFERLNRSRGGEAGREGGR
ncbi:MAG: hypothetical protein OXL34_07835 [Gemmatimonadota bacterium]|nr:hypothetical protein [Gemmatimonadota bacterium]